MQQENIIQQYLPQIQSLMKKYGVERAYAFGSAVKGTMREDSDVDFIIRFPSDMDYVTYTDNYFALMYALQDLLNKDVDLVTEKTLKNSYLVKNIDSHKLQLI